MMKLEQAQDQAPPAAPEQPSDQTPGQPSAADVPDTSAAAPAPPDDPSVSVLQRNFTHLTGGEPDFNRVIHMAKQYQDLERGGYAALADRAGELGEGVDGFYLASILNTGEAAPEVPVQDQEPPPQPGFPDQQPDVNALLDQRFQQFRSEWTEEQNTKQASQTERDAYHTALKELGFERKPQMIDFNGAKQEIDPYYDHFLMPAAARTVSRMVAAGLNRNDPQYHQKLNAPAPPQLVKAAVEWLAPYLTTQSQQNAEAFAASQSDIPPTGLSGAGPSGRSDQKDISKMSFDERKTHIQAAAKRNPNWIPEE